MNEEIKVLIFCLNNEYYAADIMEVERILGYEPTTPLPDSPEYIVGVRNYEGSILPVLKLSKRFAMVEKADKNVEDSKVIVVKDGHRKFGIMVDVVSEVSDVDVNNIEEAPEIIRGISKRYLQGLIKLNDKIVIFLNLSKILSEEEKSELDM